MILSSSNPGFPTVTTTIAQLYEMLQALGGWVNTYVKPVKKWLRASTKPAGKLDTEAWINLVEPKPFEWFVAQPVRHYYEMVELLRGLRTRWDEVVRFYESSWDDDKSVCYWGPLVIDGATIFSLAWMEPHEKQAYFTECARSCVSPMDDAAMGVPAPKSTSGGALLPWAHLFAHIGKSMKKGKKKGHADEPEKGPPDCSTN
jgi:hypothetical protein